MSDAFDEPRASLFNPQSAIRNRIVRNPINLCCAPADRGGMKARRRQERSLCADLLKIRWKDESGRSRKEVGILEDISSKGVCLQVERPILPDTLLSLVYPGGTYHGRVKYCIAQESRYFVGVEFNPGYKWSKPRYKPSHLLELKDPPDGVDE
jgi:hypothetical protein